MMPPPDSSLAKAVWVQRAYRLLGQIPELPSEEYFKLHPTSPGYTRMYSAFEARAWVASNLMWFEEALDLLVDARYALDRAKECYGSGFPAPVPGDLSIPGAYSVERRSPSYDPETIARARSFRYHIDDAAIRCSSSFEKAAALLGSYYSLEFSRKTKLLNKLKGRWPGDPLVAKLGEIIGAEAYKQGQDYRNPRIHGLGASFRALYGGGPEIMGVLVAGGGAVGIAPRPAVTGEHLLTLAHGFFDAAVSFLWTSVALIQAHPRRFTPSEPYIARRIQKPMMHRPKDAEGKIEYTDTFYTDEEICCTAFAHNAGGHVVRIIWEIDQKREPAAERTIADDSEQHVTARAAPEPGQHFGEGRGFVEWWLDDQRLWRVRFRLVKRPSA